MEQDTTNHLNFVIYGSDGFSDENWGWRNIIAIGEGVIGDN